MAVGDPRGLSDRFLERDDVARTPVVALPAGQRSLLLGPPGTAGSEPAREWTGRVEGAAHGGRSRCPVQVHAPTGTVGPVDVLRTGASAVPCLRRAVPPGGPASA